MAFLVWGFKALNRELIKEEASKSTLRHFEIRGSYTPTLNLIALVLVGFF